MAEKKKRSGIAALASLASKQKDSNSATLTTLDINLIVPAEIQDRTIFDEAEIKALAESIKENGLAEPITVRPKDNGEYEIAAGERRWRACKLNRYTTMDVLVRDLTDEQADFHMLVENLGKENLSPIEIGAGLKRRMENYGLSVEDLAKQCTKSVSWVKTHLAYNSYPEGTRSLAAKRIVSYHDSLRKLKKLELSDPNAFSTMEAELTKGSKLTFDALLNSVTKNESDSTGEPVVVDEPGELVDVEDENEATTSSNQDDDKTGTEKSEPENKPVMCRVSIDVLAGLFSRAERLPKSKAYSAKDRDTLLEKLKALESKVVRDEV